MKTWLINKIKHISLLYCLYYYFGNALLWLFKPFFRTDEKLILFVSFGGKKYDDSPRVIYEQMLCDMRFEGNRFVWAFLQPEKFDIPKGEKVKIDTLRFYKIALKSRVWITNSSVERGLSFKKKNTFYYNSWHGSAIKKMGSDIQKSNDGFKSKGSSRVDVMAAQGKFDVDVFSRVFCIQYDKFQITGLPRNDRLANYSGDYRNKLRMSLNLNSHKKVILYAPTYREYEFDGNGVYLTTPIDMEEWQLKLSNKYILLFRAHHAVARSLRINDNEFIRDVSKYPKLEDLMIVSDLLISDYSSILFDYSIMGKPMLCYTYDYEKYEKERGVYFDVREKLPSASTEDEMIERLVNLDFFEASNQALKFRDSYVTAFGNATKQTLDIFAKELKL